MKNSFTFKQEWYDLILGGTDKEILEFLQAIIRYGLQKGDHKREFPPEWDRFRRYVMEQIYDDLDKQQNKGE